MYIALDLHIIIVHYYELHVVIPSLLCSALALIKQSAEEKERSEFKLALLWLKFNFYYILPLTEW